MVWAETDARDPLGVALVGDGELTITESVPELDGTVAGSGDDLTVVGGKRDREDVAGVSDEAAGGLTGGQLPEAQGLVPRGGQSVCTIGGDHLHNTNRRVSLSLPSTACCRTFLHSPRRCESDPSGCAWGHQRCLRSGYCENRDVRLRTTPAIRSSGILTGSR